MEFYVFNRAMPGSRLRPDAVSYSQRIVRALKPNAVSGIAEGWRQAEGYKASSSVPVLGRGSKLTVRGLITGPRGQTWNVRTAWVWTSMGTVRLITATP